MYEVDVVPFRYLNVNTVEQVDFSGNKSSLFNEVVMWSHFLDLVIIWAKFCAGWSLRVLAHTDEQLYKFTEI